MKLRIIFSIFWLIKLSYAAITAPSQENFEWPTLEELREAQLSCDEDCPEDLAQDPQLRVKVNSSGIICVPGKNHLRERICVIAHLGPAGHRGILTTQRAIASKFFWPSMSVRISNFSNAFLHCIGSKDSKVPRPFVETFHASERNEVLHYDFMFVRRSEDTSVPQYILVIKDYLSHYVELCPAATADHFAVADCLLEWYKRFNGAKIHESDRGTHFKNSVIAELNRIFRWINISQGLTRLKATEQLKGSTGKFCRCWKVLLRNSGCHGINGTNCLQVKITRRRSTNY